MQQIFDIDDASFYLSEINHSQIPPNCIFTDPIFANNYAKVANKKLLSFVRPKVDLRHSALQLTFSDIMTKNKETELAYTQILDAVKAAGGCLISSHGHYWNKLAKDSILAHRYAFMVDKEAPNRVFWVRPYFG